MLSIILNMGNNICKRMFSLAFRYVERHIFMYVKGGWFSFFVKDGNLLDHQFVSYKKDRWSIFFVRIRFFIIIKNGID